MAEAWVGDVLDFWFKELTRKDWFEGGTELDEKIRNRFLALYERLKVELEAKNISDAKTALAAVIVFDQFPRNMFRSTPAAFGTDDLALAIARRALDHKFDIELDDDARGFLYMPFMHSEVAADQERCVDLFRSLPNEEGLKYAIEHRDIIAKFGRFPHRNRILARENTEAEKEFLKSHAGYGQ
ncbi:MULTISPECIES: DUF924 family protein [unclassified Aminobacter]|uniref:DUF924 family protein n=1 Tax=unclassified Aminobacter TaxID=2644704 RepID=UPI0004649C08|nr:MULTISPECIES: DUF924 family protein [unclassified Aminobacter]TWH28354.1 uncharacterized protein (DUF924 family) [Aminobacter sp. J15]